MKRAGARSNSARQGASEPLRPLPRGINALPADQVAEDQRKRILAALPEVVAEHGYDGATVAHIVARAGVARGAFYKQFRNRRDCFAAAHEAGQERLLGVLTLPCYARAGLTERVEGSLRAGLDLLASDPALARLLTVEAPAAGAEIARRHHEWLSRYGSLLRLAAVGVSGAEPPDRAVERVIAGGIASRIAGEVLEDRADSLPDLVPGLVAYVLAFYSQPQGESDRLSAASEAGPVEPAAAPAA